MKRILPAVAATVFALVAALGYAQGWEAGTDGLARIPALTQRVTDLAATLTPPERQALEDKLAAWEQATGNQLVVLSVPSTKPEPIEAYSIRVAEAWKIGRKGNDNGALFLIAKDDKKMRIEVGYGLEGSLTDATARRIIAETVAPYFRQTQFAAGINAGVDQIIAVVNKGEPLAGPPATPAKRVGGGFSFETLLILLFVVVPVLGSMLRRIFGKALGSTVGAGVVGAAAWFVAGSLAIAIVAAIVAFIVMLMFGLGSGLARRGGGVWLPSGGGGWGGGGWSGGGGGGGFSGGGGGFGGGGASGGWD
ncbi:MAG: TPM domain-containing protein [Casimicrobiaceae bacterium]